MVASGDPLFASTIARIRTLGTTRRPRFDVHVPGSLARGTSTARERRPKLIRGRKRKTASHGSNSSAQTGPRRSRKQSAPHGDGVDLQSAKRLESKVQIHSFHRFATGGLAFLLSTDFNRLPPSASLRVPASSRACVLVPPVTSNSRNPRPSSSRRRARARVSARRRVRDPNPRRRRLHALRRAQRRATPAETRAAEPNAVHSPKRARDDISQPPSVRTRTRRPPRMILPTRASTRRIGRGFLAPRALARPRAKTRRRRLRTSARRGIQVTGAGALERLTGHPRNVSEPGGPGRGGGIFQDYTPPTRLAKA